MSRDRLSRIACSKTTLLLILLLCLVLRVGMSVRQSRQPIRSDEVTYTHIARHIARGHGFAWGTTTNYGPTAHGNPLYPYFLGTIFRLVGYNLPFVRVLQSVIDTLICLLVFGIALKVTSNRAAATFAAFLYAVYPPFIISAASILTETLSLLVITGAVYLYWLALRGGMRLVLASAALTGLAVLVRPSMLLFPLVPLLGFWLNRREDRSWLAKGVVYVAISYLVVSPWTIRNYLVFHAFVPVSTHGGSTFFGGSGPADGMCMANPAGPIAVLGEMKPTSPDCMMVTRPTYEKLMRLRKQISRTNEVGRDKLYTQAAFREIRRHPARWTYISVKKFFRLWFNVWYDEPLGSPPLAVLKQIRWRPFYNLFLLILAVAGYKAGTVDRRFAQAVLMLAVYLSVVSMVTYSVVRYSYPAFPLIMVLSGGFLAAKLTKPPVVERRTP